MIDIFKILSNTTVEGPGKRFCIWVQGCKKHCRDCYAKQTWEFGVGTKFEVQDLYNMIISEQEIEGVTFLGGEPFEQASELSELAQMVKEKGLSVVCFTGYTYQELVDKKSDEFKNFLNNIDLLIDGGFEVENYDLSRPWVGSSNQNYIFLTDRYNEKEVLSYKNKIEAHIKADGKLELNGMGDFKDFERIFLK